MHFIQYIDILFTPLAYKKTKVNFPQYYIASPGGVGGIKMNYINSAFISLGTFFPGPCKKMYLIQSLNGP